VAVDGVVVRGMTPQEVLVPSPCFTRAVGALPQYTFDDSVCTFADVAGCTPDQGPGGVQNRARVVEAWCNADHRRHPHASTAGPGWSSSPRTVTSEATSSATSTAAPAGALACRRGRVLGQVAGKNQQYFGWRNENFGALQLSAQSARAGGSVGAQRVSRVAAGMGAAARVGRHLQGRRGPGQRGHY